jgi:hypothetical protein
MDQAALNDILSVARERNVQLDVTGILLHRDGNFIQVLEGPKDNVEMLYEKISRDPRHTGVLVTVREEIVERQFKDWAMGFGDVRLMADQQQGEFSEYLDASQHGGRMTRSLIFLSIFKRYIR